MKRKCGYLLLESSISLIVITVLISILYSIFIFTINLKTKIEDKMELQQQSLEITKSIEGIISNSMGIINIPINEGELKQVNSIKCRYIDESLNGNEDSIKNKEIILNERRNKLFVNSLDGENSQPGGYEIGDYVDEMYLSIEKGGKYVNIVLVLSKHKQKYETKFKINILNF